MLCEFYYLSISHALDQVCFVQVFQEKQVGDIDFLHKLRLGVSELLPLFQLKFMPKVCMGCFVMKLPKREIVTILVCWHISRQICKYFGDLLISMYIVQLWVTL